MATPLIVNVVELLRWPGSTKDVDVAVEVTDFEFGDPRILNEPIEVKMHLESLSNGVMVQGTVGATFAGECRRCLAPVKEKLTVEISEMYQQVLEDPDAYAIENDQINLLPMVRENVLLAVPLGPLCSEECPGICPQCGADLKQGACGCQTELTDPRWAALEGLKGTFDSSPE